MNIEKRQKLHKLILSLKSGTVITSKSLRKLEISDQLKKSYISNGWLEQIANGACKKYGDVITIFGALYSLQRDGFDVHIGGKTALTLAGRAHNISMTKEKLIIFTDSAIPKWFKENYVEESFIMRNKLFKDNIGVSKRDVDSFEMQVSSNERAIFEMINQFPDSITIEELSHLLENLNDLRPSLVNSLLDSCNSVLVNRIFIFLAKRTNHVWFKHIHYSKKILGLGTRKIRDIAYINSDCKLVMKDQVNGTNIY